MNYNRLKKVWPVISTVLTGVGIAETFVETAKKADEASRWNLYFRELEEGLDGEKIVWWQKAWQYAKVYKVPLAIAALTFANVVGSNVISAKQQASLLALYELTKKEGMKYKNQVLEFLGPEKVMELEKKIHEAAELPKDPIENDLGTDIEGDEYFCFHDDIFGLNMTRTLAEMNHAKYEMLKQLSIDEILYLDDAYRIMGVPEDEIPKASHDIFWDLETMVHDNHPWIDVEFIRVKTEDGMDFMEISYPYMPMTKEDYLLNLEYERKLNEKEE